MNITVVCSHCRNHDKDPNIEINFRDNKIYYVCPECKKESVISLKASLPPLPKTRTRR
jgi:predicted RNA-binding Zn-ribbon protein involved in translation (DUF1610 family)